MRSRGFCCRWLMRFQKVPGQMAKNLPRSSKMLGITHEFIPNLFYSHDDKFNVPHHSSISSSQSSGHLAGAAESTRYGSSPPVPKRNFRVLFEGSRWFFRGHRLSSTAGSPALEGTCWPFCYVLFAFIFQSLSGMIVNLTFMFSNWYETEETTGVEVQLQQKASEMSRAGAMSFYQRPVNIVTPVEPKWVMRQLLSFWGRFAWVLMAPRPSTRWSPQNSFENWPLFRCKVTRSGSWWKNVRACEPPVTKWNTAIGDLQILGSFDRSNLYISHGFAILTIFWLRCGGAMACRKVGDFRLCSSRFFFDLEGGRNHLDARKPCWYFFLDKQISEPAAFLIFLFRFAVGYELNFERKGKTAMAMWNNGWFKFDPFEQKKSHIYSKRK